VINNYRYLKGEGFERYYFSKGWGFPNWIGFSQWFKKGFGVYPDQMYPGILVKLARMPKRVRDLFILPELMKT